MRKVLVVCGVVVFTGLMGSAVSAQQATSRARTEVSGASDTTNNSSVSRREQLARALADLRESKSEAAVAPAVNPPSTTPQSTTPSDHLQPEELFLDLRGNSDTAESTSPSSQAAASSLDVSMASSPTQVLMRAVAWIAIILCVCCLVILGARHWQRQRGLLPTTSSRSKVLETLSLGPSRTVSLIEMHGYRALVASDATGIRSLVLAPSSFEETMENEVVENTET